MYTINVSTGLSNWIIGSMTNIIQTMSGPNAPPPHDESVQKVCIWIPEESV
jgi:hypothetical protein